MPFLTLTLSLLVLAPLCFARPVIPFCHNYAQCQEMFLETARKAAPQTLVQKLKVPSSSDQNLLIQSLYLPPIKTRSKLLILSSGVHGVEGFVGTSIQNYFLKEVLPSLRRDHLGILLFQGLNPYGMKYGRRVSENNVDLNRNFSNNADLFQLKNPGYTKLKALLNPETKTSTGTFTRLHFFWSVLTKLLFEDMAALRQATLQGQYEHPKGIYFGGSTFEPQRDLITDMVKRTASDYATVLILDLHTGYGKKGVLHLFPSEKGRALGASLEKDLYEGFQLEATSGSDFYDNYGDFSTHLAEVLNASGKIASPLVLEYGTMDSQTTRGAVESLRRVIAENQLHHFGATDERTAKQIKEEFLEAYFPKDIEWMMSVTTETKRILPTLIKRFEIR